jgi:hypothetical protein
MRAQKIREEADEKERDEHFNDIWPVILTRQEWRVDEKADTPAPMASDNNMDLLNNDEPPLIKNRSPFTLPAEFRAVEEEVAQMCLNPKEVMFEKPEELSQHWKPLYVQGHIDGKPISRMLVDGSVAINLMPYSIFKKLGREDDELMKTNLTLNGVGATLLEA